MSAAGEPLSESTTAVDMPVAELVAQGWWDRLDERLERWSDALNPILVKEARQSLRSRQFIGTFWLLLAAGWLTSLFWLFAIHGPAVMYRAEGYELFCVYYTGLSLALLVIVPYGAFSSLAGERSDRTYELVAITGLSPWQIVLGKLAGAALQLMIYLSVAAPFLAFTYLLRGIEARVIFMVISCLVGASLTLCTAALFLATVARERHWQTILGVILVLGLVLGYFIQMSIVFELRRDFFRTVVEETTPIILLIFWSIAGSLFLLFAQATASHLSFEADNRSSGLRRIMLFHQALFAAWMGWFYLRSPWTYGDREVLFIFVVLSGLYWYVMGALMSAESNVLSPRVRRELPQRWLERVLLSGLMPGPGVGYLFVVANLIAVAGMALVAQELVDPFRARTRGWPSHDGLILFTLLGGSYIVIYLGLGKKLVDALRAHAHFSFVLPLVLQVMLLIGFCFMPIIISVGISGRPDYSPLHWLNVFFTLDEVTTTRGMNNVSVLAAIVVLPLLAFVIFLWNLPATVAELRQGPLPTPERLIEDEQAAAQLARARQRQSPWDEGEK